MNRLSAIAFDLGIAAALGGIIYLALTWGLS